jgi:hypothetical protein
MTDINSQSLVVEKKENSSSSRLLCQMEELTHGRWINVTYPVPPYIPMKGEVQQKKCVHVQPNEPFHTWEWQTDHPTCLWKPRFGKNDFCRVAAAAATFTGGNLTIAIVGDSTSFDHFLSLTHLLGVPQALPKARRKDALLISRPSCNIEKDLNLTLIGKRSFYLLDLQEFIQQQLPDILIINRGAHYTSDERLEQDAKSQILPALEEWQSSDYCRRRHRHDAPLSCWLIWRNSVPGHPNCANYTQPFFGPMSKIEATMKQDRNYHWSEFKNQSLLFQQWLNQSHLQYDIMDGYPMKIRRPDAHDNDNPNDCLHTCLPGDDLYSQLLTHMLQLKIDEHSDVASVQSHTIHMS